MTLRHMAIFCAVYKNECNTTKAAASLNMTQPAVSLAIKELEQYYGVELFSRLGKRLRITEAGLRFYEYSSHIYSLYQDMELSLKSINKAGTIRIGASISIGSHMLPSYIKSFNNRYPDSKVKVTIAQSEQLETKIINSELDFALIEGLIHHPDIVSYSYMQDHLSVICSKDSPFENGQTITLNEFKSQNFLLREKKSATRQLFDIVTKQAGIEIDPAWESASTTAIISGVVNNLGITVLPERLLQSCIANKSVKIINVENLSFERCFKLIHHKDKLITPTMKDFMNICTANVLNRGSCPE